MKQLRLFWALYGDTILYALVAIGILYIQTHNIPPLRAYFLHYATRGFQTTAYYVGRAGLYTERAYHSAIERERLS